MSTLSQAQRQYDRQIPDDDARDREHRRQRQDPEDRFDAIDDYREWAGMEVRDE